MSTTISTSKARPFYKNKYIEYRKQYDEARNFSKSLDSSSSSDTSKASKDPLPPETASKETDTPAAGTKPHLHKKGGESPFGVKSSDDDSSTIDSASASSAPAPLSTSGQVNIPNTGAASDRMMDRAKELEPYIRAAADRYGLPPELIAGIIWQESRGNPRAVSHCGAMGLMQLMPATAASMGISNPFDAAQNIDGGAKYIRQMLDKFNGRVDFAVAAYNAGPGNVSKFGGIPPFRETQDYVPKVLGFANSFRVAQAFPQGAPSNAVSV